MSIFEFDDQQGVRTRGTLRAPGATPGDVLTVGTSRGTVAPSPGGGSQPQVLVAQQRLTHAQILALPTTPVELVATPGAGKAIWPLDVLAVCDTTAGAYTNLSTGGELGPYYENDSPGDLLAYLVDGGGDGDVANLIAYHGVAAATFSALAAIPPGPQTFGFAQGGYGAPFENLAYVFGAVNTDGDYTGGDPANSMLLAVRYSILDVTP